MYVLLDVIYNHTGNNWFYDNNGVASDTMPYRAEPPYPFKGWRSKTGECIDRIADPDDGVWPVEFQNPEWYSRAGSIQTTALTGNLAQRCIPGALGGGATVARNDGTSMSRRLARRPGRRGFPRLRAPKTKPTTRLGVVCTIT